MKQMDFLSEYNRLDRLSELGDPLEKVASSIDWELFRPIIDNALRKESYAKGGRPPYDAVMMFKIAMLQQWYGIADDNTEFLINDRLSFQRFLGISLGDKVPDAKTIWLFKEKLSETGISKKLFAKFEREMERQKVITRKGSIVDATFVEAPRQRNSKDENELLKSGKLPPEWKGNINKIRQKDTDARWTKKRETFHFGYKNHIKVDKDSKMIVTFSVTDASVHDNKEIAGLIDIRDKKLWADSAYANSSLVAYWDIRKNASKMGIDIQIHERAYRGKPLTEKQKVTNLEKSKVRARVEHVFGLMKMTMGGCRVRCIGLKRVSSEVAIKNLAYNLKRFIFLSKRGIIAPITG